MRFRTTLSAGLLLWSGRTDHTRSGSDFLALGIKDGFVHLRYNLGSGEGFIAFNSTKVDDSHWHRLKATR